MSSNFEKELEQLINKHSIENESNTPDFILSRYLMNCLQSYEIALDSREKWYGRKDKNSSVGFKDVEDCKWNKSEESDLKDSHYLMGKKTMLNEGTIILSKQDGGLEKIIKYVSKLNSMFGYPYYFTWSLANNYYDESPSGIIKDPGYASLRVGRHMIFGKNLEMLLLFGPINSIVDTHMAFRFLIEPKNGEINFELNHFKTYFCKRLIDESLQKMYGNSWDDFMVVPPTEGKPMSTQNDESPKAVVDPYLAGADAATNKQPKHNPYDVNKEVHRYYNYEMGYGEHKLVNQIIELKQLNEHLRKINN
jgi:hypothetical protein